MDVGEQHVQRDRAVPPGCATRTGQVGPSLAGRGGSAGTWSGCMPCRLVWCLAGDEPLKAAGVVAVEPAGIGAAFCGGGGRLGGSGQRWGRTAVGPSGCARGGDVAPFAQQAVPVVARVEGGCGRRRDDGDCSWVRAGKTPHRRAAAVECRQAGGPVGPLLVDRLSHDGAHRRKAPRRSRGGLVATEASASDVISSTEVHAAAIRRLREVGATASRDQQQIAARHTGDRAVCQSSSRSPVRAVQRGQTHPRR